MKLLKSNGRKLVVHNVGNIVFELVARAVP
jgi:hypothetical protein